MKITARIAAIMAASLLWASPPLWAQSTQGVLVELFTSQGCSSCPPADALLEKMTTVPGVIPLALHVDYWDYIGWRDTFAQEKFSDRQRRYARARSEKMVYTPQIIIAGDVRLRSPHEGELRAAIAAAASDVALNLVRSGQDIEIRAEVRGAVSGPFVVDMVRYRPKSTVKIEHGENGGMAVRYSNIVTQWENLGTWSGQGPLTMRAPAPGDGPVVVIIQRPGPRHVVASAVLK